MMIIVVIRVMIMTVAVVVEVLLLLVMTILTMVMLVLRAVVLTTNDVNLHCVVCFLLAPAGDGARLIALCKRTHHFRSVRKLIVDDNNDCDNNKHDRSESKNTEILESPDLGISADFRSNNIYIYIYIYMAVSRLFQ